ncbi:S8 family serine peptidase [Flaviaesturariibacter aridisoli]|uniref:T9SS type A sorting domain-containing protein n=1 Tax=Flaviaesturariibacter aridisoli TaxID=2545761 RepID=A0A4R4DX31_9BACT|nr:S8 family serine peptidase [Flaviaesturariibacter aridisoli]TCZ67337.1 T9SS type A sorting domain-containing protein [Flaviaesturariibacter aridisoli]
MKSKKLLVALALLAGLSSEAQVTRYVVKLRNKGSNTFSLAAPDAYLSPRAVARRTRYGIAIDSTDLPLSQRYLDSIASVPNLTILNRSKWLNEVSIQTTDAAALTRIQGFSFVQSVGQLSARFANGRGPLVAAHNKFTQPAGTAAPMRVQQTEADSYNYGQSAAQVKIHNGQFLHNIGLHGEGMMIGMLDAGYQNYLTVPSLDSVRLNGQILGVYDFVALDGSVNEDDAHGGECFSTIAANKPGTFVGTAPKASFWLFRTENAATETPIEEFNWVCGAERVDSVGGDLLSSSLGYNTFDAPFGAQSHTYADLDGNTTRPAIGADLAAKKGILVVNAAGNEGTNGWFRIITPADGDSVLAVGAVNSAGVPANFSSRGPSSDRQVKPDVASVGVGTIVQYPGGTIAGGNGTSFATPNLAGLITCLWQGFPELNNMAIIDALRQSGTKATAPDSIVGYGIPDVRKALIALTKTQVTSASTQGNCKATISWSSKDVSGMRYELQRNVPGQAGYTTVFSTAGTGPVFGARHNYQYADTLTGVAAGTVNYRVVQYFDTSVASPASDIIATQTINLSAACTGTGINAPGYSDRSIVLQPNPARNTVTVQLTLPSAESNLLIVVTDAIGKQVHQQKWSAAAGSTLVPVSVSKFASGKYFVSVYAGGRLIGTRELVKL